MKNIIKYILTVGVLFALGLFCTVNAQSDYTHAQVNLSETQPEKTDYAKLSSIEKLLNADMESKEPLRQIGYDFFSSSMSQGFGKYEGSYKLNIGEKLDVYFWGDSVDMFSISGTSMLSPLTKSQVDSKGNVFISGVGPVKAEGRSIADVEREIQSKVSQKFTNAKVKITVADSTEFAIFVYGDVKKPGKVTVGNNSSIIEALAAAGGVNKNGSLRNITYKSNGRAQKVDLYKIIFAGQDSGIRIQPNDTIFVDKIGPVVAIKNGVKTPGIYEVTSSDSISDIIGYAHGFLPSADKSVVNVKTYKNGQRSSTDVHAAVFTKTIPANGDILEFKSVYGKAEDFVSLTGNIKHPGIFEYKKGMKLSDILKNKNELQDETFIYQAVIKRTSGTSKEIKSIPVSLQDFFNGKINPELKPKDIITVYKNTNADFIEVYGCIDNPKRIPYNENLTLKNIIAGTQFILTADSESSIYNISTTASSEDVLIPADDVAVEITNDKNEKTFYLYDILVQNDSLQSISISKGDKVFFRPLRNDEIIKTVKLSGYVKKPGVYRFVEGKKLSDMVETAGGLTKDANLKGIVFKRANLASKQRDMITEKNIKDVKQLTGQMASDMNPSKDNIESRQAALEEITSQNEIFQNKFLGRISLDIKNNDIVKITEAENIEVQDGDEIYIPKLSNHVMVIGEVYNETSFIYKNGAKASYYIKLVGGYTPNARKTKLYKIGVNGRASKLNLIASNQIEPGDTIVVPRKLRGNDWIQPLTSTLQSIVSVLTSIFIVTKL